MSLGVWAAGIAGDDEELQGILSSVPGPICSDINRAIPSRPTKLTREPRHAEEKDADAYDTLRGEAEEAIEERDRAISMLEDCRTAIETVREALVDVVKLYRLTLAKIGGSDE